MVFYPRDSSHEWDHFSAFVIVHISGQEGFDRYRILKRTGPGKGDRWVFT